MCMWERDVLQLETESRLSTWDVSSSLDVGSGIDSWSWWVIVIICLRVSVLLSGLGSDCCVLSWGLGWCLVLDRLSFDEFFLCSLLI